MNLFRVALLQLVSAKTQSENLQKGLAACRQAKQQGADLALFPEMWNTGYTFAQNALLDEAQQGAIAEDDAFLAAFQALAQELNMAIAITYLARYTPRPRNAMTVFDRHGNAVLTYAKVHTCDFGDEQSLTPGDDFMVANLDTSAGNVAIGAMICYDREFPESARILMLKGAEIVLVPNACPMELNRLAQLRTRAFENMMGIATTNYAAGQPGCNGHSSAYDGIAYGETDTGADTARDTLMIETGEAEGVYLASFPMHTLRKYRETEVHGNAYRRPEKYALLVAEGVAEPFVRRDARR